MRRLFACFVALLLFGGGLLLVHPPAFGDWGFSFWDVNGSPASDPSSTDQTDDEPDDPSSDPSACTTDQKLTKTLNIMGLGRDEVRLGNEVKWALAPEDQPRGAFSSEEVRTRADLKRLLNSNGVAGPASRMFLADLSDDDYERALTGEGFVPIQPKHRITLRGNNQLVNGDAVDRASTSKLGEVFWVYLPKRSCDLTMVTAFRTWCGNPVFWLAEWIRE